MVHKNGFILRRDNKTDNRERVEKNEFGLAKCRSINKWIIA